MPDAAEEHRRAHRGVPRPDYLKFGREHFQKVWGQEDARPGITQADYNHTFQGGRRESVIVYFENTQNPDYKHSPASD